LRFQMSTFCVDHPPNAGNTHTRTFLRGSVPTFSEMCVACRLPFIIISQNSLLYLHIFLGCFYILIFWFHRPGGRRQSF
jgi:hypothetical protein